MDVESQRAVLDELLLVPERVDDTYLPSLIAPSIKGLISRDNNKENRSLMIQLASTYNVRLLEPELLELVDIQNEEIDEKVAALRALRVIGSNEVTHFSNLVADQSEEQQIRLEALRALIETGDEQAYHSLLEHWPNLNLQLRNVAVEQLSSSMEGGRVLLQSVENEILSREDLDGRAIDRLYILFFRVIRVGTKPLSICPLICIGGSFLLVILLIT
jgi:HEAT repeat protein